MDIRLSHSRASPFIFLTLNHSNVRIHSFVCGEIEVDGSRGLQNHTQYGALKLKRDTANSSRGRRGTKTLKRTLLYMIHVVLVGFCFMLIKPNIHERGWEVSQVPDL